MAPKFHDLAHIRRSEITIDPEKNARRTVYRKELEELCSDITHRGMLEPVGVRRTGENAYDLVFGYRRMWCANKLALEIVPCVILDIEEAETYDTMLAENLHREGVASWDLGEAVVTLQKKGYSGTDIAARLSLVTGQSQKLAKIFQLAITSAGLIPELKEVWKRNLKDFNDERAYQVAQMTTLEQEEFLRELIPENEPNPIRSGSGEPTTRRKAVRKPTSRTIELAYQSLRQNDDDDYDDGIQSKEVREALRSFMHWILGGRKKCPIKLRKRGKKEKTEE